MLNIRSMTGYGRTESLFQDKRILVEIKSLNSKQNDLLVKLPPIYNEFEIELRSQISLQLKRGKIYCQVTIDYQEGALRLNINKSLALKYLEELQHIKSLASLKDPSDLMAIAMRMPDVVSNDGQKISEKEAETLKNTIQDALNLVDEFRLQEGQILAADFQMRIDNIRNLLKDILPLEKERIKKVREKLETEIENIGNKYTIDSNRFEQELIYYLEKLDVTEEKIRLTKHCDYFIDTLIAEEEEKGKKLGFITQEIGREINTLGSKANFAPMQKIVVQMKDELEKIKEQLLNIL